MCIILYVARSIVMYFQSGKQDHLGWPPLLYPMYGFRNSCSQFNIFTIVK